MKYLTLFLFGLFLTCCNDDNFGPLEHKINTDFTLSVAENSDSLILILKSKKEYVGQYNRVIYSIEHLNNNTLELNLISLQLCNICQRILLPTYNEITVGLKSIDKYSIDIKVKRRTQRVTYENGQLDIDKKGAIEIDN